MSESALVDFLRHEADLADSDGCPDAAERLREAADEIERLQKALSQLQYQLRHVTSERDDILRERNRFDKEIERLRQLVLDVWEVRIPGMVVPEDVVEGVRKMRVRVEEPSGE